MQCACHGTASSQALLVTQRVMCAGRDSAQGGMPKRTWMGLRMSLTGVMADEADRSSAPAQTAQSRSFPCPGMIAVVSRAKQELLGVTTAVRTHDHRSAGGVCGRAGFETRADALSAVVDVLTYPRPNQPGFLGSCMSNTGGERARELLRPSWSTELAATQWSV